MWKLAGRKLLHNICCGGDFHSSILITADADVLSVTEKPPKHDVFPDVGVDPDDFSDHSADATTDSMCSRHIVTVVKYLVHCLEILVHFMFSFYRAMHFCAKRGIVIACRPSVCNVGGSGPHRLEILETNFTDN